MPDTHSYAIQRGDAAAAPAPLLVYVQLRPRWAVVAKAMAALDALIEAHPAVAVSVCGVSKDVKYLRVTLSVALGPAATVARFSPESTAAYTFVSEIFQRLFDHAPCYVCEPVAVERLAAASLSRPTVSVAQINSIGVRR